MGEGRVDVAVREEVGGGEEAEGGFFGVCEVGFQGVRGGGFGGEDLDVGLDVGLGWGVELVDC